LLSASQIMADLAWLRRVGGVVCPLIAACCCASGISRVTNTKRSDIDRARRTAHALLILGRRCMELSISSICQVDNKAA
jgi:hypothetical protein